MKNVKFLRSLCKGTGFLSPQDTLAATVKLCSFTDNQVTKLVS